MTQLHQGMQALRRELQKREIKIKRVAYLTAVKFSPVVDNAFSVTGYWALNGGGEHTKVFTPAVAFTASGKQLSKTPCKFADDVIREILTARGIGC